MESKLNTSNVPLNSKGLFIGGYESVSEFSSIVISIYSDTANIISCYQSLNKQLANVSVFNSVPNVQSTFVISPVILPYVYFTVRNNTETNQTVLNFSVSYKNAAYSISSKQSATIWDNAVVNPNDVSSNYINASLANNQSVSIFGSSSDATTITILVSNDNLTYYDTQYTYDAKASSDFGFSLVLPFKYLKLSSSGATTITASACWC